MPTKACLILFFLILLNAPLGWADGKRVELQFYISTKTQKSLFWNGQTDPAKKSSVTTPSQWVTVTPVGPDLVQVTFDSPQVLTSSDPDRMWGNRRTHFIQDLVIRVHPADLEFLLNDRKETFLIYKKRDYETMRAVVEVAQESPLDEFLRFIMERNMPEVSLVKFTKVFLRYEDVIQENAIIEGRTFVARWPMIDPDIRRSTMDPYTLRYEPLEQTLAIIDSSDSVFAGYFNFMQKVQGRYRILKERGWLSPLRKQHEPSYIGPIPEISETVVSMFQCSRVFRTK